MPRRGALLFALLVLLAGASIIREVAVGPLARRDDAWALLLARRLPAKTSQAPVTLVEINGETITKHGWPWTAEDFALFFHAALPFGPTVIGLDPILAFEHGPSSDANQDPVYEKMLHDHVLRTPKLVLGGRLRWVADSDIVSELQPMPVLRKVTGDLTAVPEFSDIAAWAEEDYRLTSQPGWTNLPDATGPAGRCPLILRYRGQPVPAIVLQVAMHFEKVTLDEVEVTLGSHVAIGSRLRVPIDSTGRMAVNFASGFERVSFEDLLLSREQIDRKEAPARPAALFSGRMVMLGRTDPQSRTVTLPGRQKIAPGEFFAAALATLELGSQPRRIGTWFDWTLVGSIAISALWLRKWRPLPTFLGAVILVGCYAACAFWMFRSQFLILPGVMPAGLTIWVLLLRLAARRIEKVIAF